MMLLENMFANQYLGNKRLNIEGNTFEINNNVAVIKVFGVIYPYIFSDSIGALFSIVDKIKADKNIKGTVFYIDSPGGSVYRNTEIYKAVSELNNTIAVVDNCCCSAAYWLASACDKIIATSELAYFGSVGVLTSRYYDNDTVVLTNRESKEKYLDLRDEQGRDKTQNMLDDIYSIFVRDVTQKRNIDKEALKGGAFRSNEALKLGLIDEINLNLEIANYFNIDKGYDISKAALTETVNKAIGII